MQVASRPELLEEVSDKHIIEGMTAPRLLGRSIRITRPMPTLGYDKQ